MVERKKSTDDFRSTAKPRDCCQCRYAEPGVTVAPVVAWADGVELGPDGPHLQRYAVQSR